MAILSRLHKDVLSVQRVQLSSDPADVMAQKRPVGQAAARPGAVLEVCPQSGPVRWCRSLQEGWRDQEGGRLNSLSVVGASLGVSSLAEEAATIPNSPLYTVPQVGFFL